MSPFIFLSLLAFCLAFQPHFTTADDGVVEEATTKALIQTACSASSSSPLCYNVLNSVANNPYLDPADLAIVSVQATSKIALATFDMINMSLTVKAQLAADPAMRQSLVLCAKEYKNVLDLMDKTATALTQKVDQSKIPEYLNSAIAAVAKCDASAIKFGNTVVQVTTKNVDTTKLIKNALSIYQVFAEYIANPSHDPKKSTIPTKSGGDTNTNTPTPNVGVTNTSTPKLGDNNTSSS